MSKKKNSNNGKSRVHSGCSEMCGAAIEKEYRICEWRWSITGDDQNNGRSSNKKFSARVTGNKESETFKGMYLQRDLVYCNTACVMISK